MELICGTFDGSWYGYGYGYGSSFKVAAYMGHLPTDAKDRALKLQKSGARLAFWKSDADGRPANGGAGEAVKPGMKQKVAGPLSLCSARALHATYNPDSWSGTRTWIVALIGEVAEQDDKLGALEREIIAELRS